MMKLQFSNLRRDKKIKYRPLTITDHRVLAWKVEKNVRAFSLRKFRVRVWPVGPVE